MKKGKIKFKFDIKKRILPVILLAICTPMILFVAIPFEIFANNMDEFLFSLSSFLPFSVLFGFLLAAGIAVGIIFLPEKAYRICYALILAFSFLFFLQGTFLNFGMDSLAGDKLGESSVHIGLKILDAFIWIAVIAAAVTLSLIKDKKGIIATIAVILSIVIVATQIINPLSNTIKHTDVFLSKTARLQKEDPDFKDKILTEQNLTAVSTERNVFYFCIDRFDDTFAEIALKKKPNIYDELDGFTWFRDHTSLYGHTFPSIAYMLNEKTFDLKTQYRKEYLDAVYNDNNTLSVLAENGYSVNLYTQAYYGYNTAYTLPDYVENVSVAKEFKTTSPVTLTRHLLTTAVYRCLPLFFKDWLNDVESRKFNECVTGTGENGYHNYTGKTESVYKAAANATFEENGKKNFTFIHVEGCHDVCIDHPKDSFPEQDQRDVAASVERNIKIVNEYIRVLKEKGLYKNATIIITGDHPDPAGDAVKWPKLTALFFKPSGVDSGNPKNEDMWSYRPVAHENIWTSIFESEGITRENGNKGLFDIPENDPTRERTYIWQTYGRKECFEYVYSVTGVGTDFKNWKLVETNHYNRYMMT